MADEAGGHISPLKPREFSGERQDWVDWPFQYKAYARRHGAVAVQLMSDSESMDPDLLANLNELGRDLAGRSW